MKNPLEQDGILMLTSDYDRRYILTGDKVGELKEKVNKNITVLGKIKYPNPKEIDGNSNKIQYYCQRIYR